MPDDVVPADIDETPQPGEQPRVLAARLAREKAAAVAKDHAAALVLAADTVVSVGRRILPKAEKPDQARECLALLSGRRHRVTSGIAVTAPGGALRHRTVETIVAFKRLSAQEIDAYLESGEWRGKAGGYAIQGLAAAFIPRLQGSYTNVVGLPVFETISLLAGAGYAPASALR